MLVRLLDHSGELLEPSVEARLDRAFPEFDDLTYPYLRLIDPYSHTTFNELQMVAVVPELERRQRELGSVSALLESVLKLARICSESPQTFLVFDGD